ncbi:hypothetical protein HK101_000173 [Irineochytrium annulatum]|nr:hypothetical protein HK101_000173 [Irineochytrium annulatum]
MASPAHDPAGTQVAAPPSSPTPQDCDAAVTRPDHASDDDSAALSPVISNYTPSGPTAPDPTAAGVDAHAAPAAEGEVSYPDPYAGAYAQYGQQAPYAPYGQYAGQDPYTGQHPYAGQPYDPYYHQYYQQQAAAAAYGYRGYGYAASAGAGTEGGYLQNQAFANHGQAVQGQQGDQLWAGGEPAPPVNSPVVVPEKGVGAAATAAFVGVAAASVAPDSPAAAITASPSRKGTKGKTALVSTGLAADTESSDVVAKGDKAKVDKTKADKATKAGTSTSAKDSSRVIDRPRAGAKLKIDPESQAERDIRRNRRLRKLAITLLILLPLLIALAVLGYIYWPRFPKIQVLSLTLLSDHNAQGNHTSSFIFSTAPGTTNLNTLTLEIKFVLNISVVNPNPYDLTVDTLNLNAYLKVNQSQIMMGRSPSSLGIDKFIGAPPTNPDPNYIPSFTPLIGTGAQGTASNSSALVFPSNVNVTFAMPFTFRYSPDPEVGLIKDPAFAEFLEVCGVTSKQRPAQVDYSATSHVSRLAVFGYAPSVSNSILIRCPASGEQIQRVVVLAENGNGTMTAVQILQEAFGG